MATPCIPNKIPDWQRGFTCSKFKFVLFGRPSWFLFWEIICKRQHIWWIVWFPQELCHNLFSRIILPCDGINFPNRITLAIRRMFAELLRLALPKHFFLSRGNHEVPIWSQIWPGKGAYAWKSTVPMFFPSLCASSYSKYLNRYQVY